MASGGRMNNDLAWHTMTMVLPKNKENLKFAKIQRSLMPRGRIMKPIVNASGWFGGCQLKNYYLAFLINNHSKIFQNAQMHSRLPSKPVKFLGQHSAIRLVRRLPAEK
jgi:hypothetical protein